MNKEEIFNEISSCFKMSVDMNGMKKIEEYITNLQQDTQKYKEVIDKAIEYINNNWDGCSYTDETLKNKVSELNITELLDILKEVE